MHALPFQPIILGHTPFKIPVQGFRWLARVHGALVFETKPFRHQVHLPGIPCLIKPAHFHAGNQPATRFDKSPDGFHLVWCQAGCVG